MENIPPLLSIFVDKGYQGIEKGDNEVFMPKKKPKSGDLTEDEIEENSIISSERMTVEHSICGIKRFGCLSNNYRNKNGKDDKLILVCAGLWNYHLRYTA